LLIAGGGAFALASASGGTITVCVRHQAARCTRRRSAESTTNSSAGTHKGRRVQPVQPGLPALPEPPVPLAQPVPPGHKGPRARVVPS
jgi:hypothetical protein